MSKVNETIRSVLFVLLFFHPESAVFAFLAVKTGSSSAPTISELLPLLLSKKRRTYDV